ncbi:sigma-70 family RNA polymerase sigma factor [Sporolactobacillus sp. THM7-7]|nr:sigma-70 family RNA polymerase sigma factor [Sporolactobacillus sp. THM7-7]
MKTQKELKDAFSQWIHPYTEAMRRFSLRLAGSPWDGDDLYQNAMIKVYRAWKKCPSRPISKAYLFRIISHAWIDSYRKVSVEECVKASFDNLAASAEGVDEEKLRAGIKLLMDRLPAKQRLIFLLSAGFNLSTREIAELTGESEGSIRVACHRARKKLELSGVVWSADSEDEWTDLYVTAFRSRDPLQLIHLYQQETGVPSQPDTIGRRKNRNGPISMDLPNALYVPCETHGRNRPDGITLRMAA